jgi:RNA polymerase sigma-70 factor (ECF subfamily)
MSDLGAASGLRFEDFFAANFAVLVIQINAHTGSMAEAQDAVQEAFCRAWPRWQTISAYDDPVAWVRRVAWNVATSRWRRAKTALAFGRRHRVETVPEPNPDQVDLVAALAKLPPAQRRALILFYLAGLSVAEIAHECEVAEGTVKSWLHRGRTALAGHMSIEGREYEHRR